MAHAVSATWAAQLDVQETLDLALDLASGASKVTHTIGTPAASGTMNATSSPAASQVSSDTRTLTAGADTIDLTAAPTRDGGTINLSGLKVQAVKVACPAGNSAVLILKAGAANGYNLGGHAGWEIPVTPGGQAVVVLPEGSPDVAAGAKDIGLASADVDAEYSFIIVAG